MSYAKGDLFEAFITTGQQVRIDTDKVKTLLQSLVDNGTMTEGQRQLYFKTIPTETVKTARIDKSLKATWVAPTLGPNTTPEMISDQLGAVRERAADDKRTEGFLKDALKRRIDPNSVAETPTFEDMGGSVEEEEGFSLERNR